MSRWSEEEASKPRGENGRLAVVNHWLLRCNPKRWDAFSWWEEGTSDLDSWTVSQHLGRITPGDTFALWVGGDEPGVYALGVVTTKPYVDEAQDEDGYWLEPHSGEQHSVGLKVDEYFFDRPIRKDDLAEDLDFQDAQILRMARSRNPLELTRVQWNAIVRHGGMASVLSAEPEMPGVVVTERLLNKVSESIAKPPTQGDRLRKQTENQLLLRYQRFLGRPLAIKSARLESGERLVSDAYDRQANLLLEAKASSCREDVRMAIGQLLDYRRHLSPNARLAVLLPDMPSHDLIDLLKELAIECLIEKRKGHFVAV